MTGIAHSLPRHIFTQNHRMEADKNHWENIYRTKGPADLSWTQALPLSSLDFIHSFGLPKTARIIDIGGGDSHLVEYLLDEGYSELTVLDISGAAIQKAQQRLGRRANQVQWIEQDITRFNPNMSYDLWHDRATFHFLITPRQISLYLSAARRAVHSGGYVVIGTFSARGPEKCSGLPVCRYSEEDLTRQLSRGFRKIRCISEDHHTPPGTIQNFLFCSFRRK
ncbi:MAG TPA: class I SAM-dependent methyltransferase [Puia sp.]|nr:class I SAM-dependent methyltransferase [Puia sp.]